MGIEKEIELRQKRLKMRLPISEDNIQKKQDAELDLDEFRLHHIFLRFLFSGVSIALYIPTVIYYFRGHYNITGFVLGFILIAVLLTIEIMMPFSLWKYFKISNSHNVKPLGRLKTTTIVLCILSVLASSLSGINAVDLFDNSQEEIVKETTNQTNKEVDNYAKLIESNDAIIKQNQNVIDKNISLVDEKKQIALTKAGKKQISTILQSNDKLQSQNDTLIELNKSLHLQVNKIRQSNEGFMFKRVLKANNKEFIFMAIFFAIGLLAVLGMIYSYSLIGKFDRNLTDNSKDIKILADLWQERTDKEHEEAVRLELREGERELKMLSVKKQLNDARTNLWKSNEDAEILIDDEKKNNKNFPNHQLIM
jgi:ASC-1-like (ASCH) protein